MKSTAQIGLIILFVFASIGIARSSAASQDDCATLNGTITGQFVPDGPQGPGWYGQAYLSFGDDGTVLAATLVDQNDGYKNHPTFTDPSGNFAGDEILTFTVDTLGSFEMKGHFIGVAGTTPFAYGFNETGKLGWGTGGFAGLTGNASIHGSFVLGGGLAAGPSADHPWVWIAQITGSACGR